MGFASEKRSTERLFGNLEINPDPPIPGIGVPAPGIGPPGPGVGGVHPAGGGVGGGGHTAALAETDGRVAQRPSDKANAARALRIFMNEFWHNCVLRRKRYADTLSQLWKHY